MQIPVTDLAPVRELYGQGLYLQAHHAACQLGPLAEWENPAARILAGRLAIQVGAPRLGRWLHLTALRATPTYHEAIYYAARYEFERHGPLAAWRFMRRHPDWGDASPPQRADWAALHGFICARLRDFDRARRWLDRADELAPNKPWLCIERAALNELEEKPEEALAIARRSLELQTWFRPGVQTITHLLMTLGRLQEAIDFIREASEAIESGIVMAQRAALHFELKQFADVQHCYDRFAELSPLMEPRTTAWLAARRADTLYFLGDRSGAAALAREVKSPARKIVMPSDPSVAEEVFYAEFAARLESHPDPSDKDRKEIDFPAPTDPFARPTPMKLIGMLARHWGTELPEPPPLGRDGPLPPDGLPDPRERLWAEENGFVAREFSLTETLAQSLIDRNIPFVIQSPDLQPQVVVGYDRLRRSLFLRGPADRVINESDLRRLLELPESPKGLRALALLPADRADELLDGLELPDADPFDRLHRLQAELRRFDRDEAEDEFDQLRLDYPDHRITLQARVAMARFDGHPVLLLQSLETLLERFPDEQMIMLGKLSALRDVGQLERRLDLLRTLARKIPVDPLYSQHYVQTLLAEGRPGGGTEYLLRRAIQYRPGAASAYFILANLLWEERAFEESVEMYRFAACLEEDDEQFAEAFFRAGRATDQEREVMRFFRERFDGRIKNASPQLASAARALFHGMAEQQEMEEAFATLERAMNTRPDDGELVLFIAGMYADYDDLDEANRYLREARSYYMEKGLPIEWLREAARLAALRCDLPEAIEMWNGVIELEPTSVEAHRHLSRHLADHEGRAAALIHVEKYCRRFPNSYPLHQLWLDWLRGEETEKGIEVVGRLIRACPQDAWAHREMALYLSTRGRHDEAIKEAELAGRYDPDHPSFFYTLGHVYFKADQPVDAMRIYQEAIRRSVSNEVAMAEVMALAKGETEQREVIDMIATEISRQHHVGDGLLVFRDQAVRVLEPEELLALFHRWLDDHADTWQIWSVTIQQLTMMGRTDEAMNLAQEATQRFPLLPRLWVDLAEVYEAMGETDEAIESLREALRTSPGWSYAARELAEALEEQVQPDEARAVLEQAIARAPFDPVNHGYLAEALWNLHESEEALDRLRKALRLDPGYDWAWRTFAEWSERLDRPDELIDLSRELTQIRPGDPRTWLALARHLIAPHHAEEAITALDHAIALQPRGAEAFDLKAERLAEMGLFEEALVTANPDTFEDELPMILHGRGAWVEAKRGNYPAAISAMRALVTIEPNYYWGWQQLAEWFNETGQPGEYLNATEELVRLRPDSPVALAVRGDAQMQTGDREGGKADLKQAQTMAPGYAYAGMLLFDACMADGETDDAQAALAILQEHTGGPFVIARQVQLAAHLGDKETALEACREVATTPSEAPWPLQASVTACRAADWGPETDQMLEEILTTEETFHPWTAIAWAEGPAAIFTLPEERLDILRKVVRLYPRFAQGWDLLAEHCARTGKFDEAREACQPEALGPLPPMILQGRAAWVEAEAGNRDRAIELIRQVIENEPGYFWGTQKLCEWLLAAERPREAIDAAERLIQLDPHDAGAYAHRGDARIQLGDRDGGKMDLRQAQTLSPSEAYAGMLLFDACLADNELAEARSALAILQEHSGGPFVAARQTQLAARLGDPEQALASLRRVVATPSDAPWPLRAAVAACRSAGLSEEVDATLLEVIESESEFHAWAAVIWGESPSGETASPEQRLAVFEKATQLHPLFPQTWDLLAEQRTQLGDYNGARAACRPEVFGDDLPLILHGRAAWIEAEAGDRDRAVELMRATVQTDPTYAWGWRQLCLWHTAAGEHHQALECAERLIELDPQDPRGFAHRGESKLHLGDRETAKHDFARAYGLDPDYAFAGLHLCDEQIEDQEYEEATHTLKMLREHVGGPLVEYRAGRLAIMTNQSEMALDVFHDLTMSEDVRPFLLTRLAQEISDAGWESDLVELLNSLIDEEEAAPTIGRLWATQAVSHADPDLEERLAELTERGELGREALRGAIDALGEPTSVDRLGSLVQRFDHELRADHLAWSKTARALVRSGKLGLAVAWVADWGTREGLEPRMLLSVSEAYRAMGRWDEGERASRAALKLPPDATTSVHAVWVALEDALAGRDAAARAQLADVEKYQLDDPVRFVYSLVESLLMVRQARAEEKSGAFREARDHIATALGAVPNGTGGPALAKAYRRCVDHLADEVGGFWAWWWQLSQRVRPPLRGSA